MAQASSSHFSPLVLCSKKLYSSRLSRPLPSKSITSKMSDNAALWNKTVQHLCTHAVYYVHIKEPKFSNQTFSIKHKLNRLLLGPRILELTNLNSLVSSSSPDWVRLTSWAGLVVVFLILFINLQPVVKGMSRYEPALSSPLHTNFCSSITHNIHLTYCCTM